MNLKRPLYGPDDPRGPSHGRDVAAIKRGLWRVEDRFFPRPEGGFDDIYNRKTAQAVQVFQRLNDIPATGDFGQSTLDALWPYMDAYARWMYRLYRPPNPVPDLGPVFRDGKSILDHDLTHATSGIDFYPAFDDAFRAGTKIIAPESLVVIKQSSSSPGDAFYATGASKIRYWFGHLVWAPQDGQSFKRGEVLGVVLDHDIGGGPHVHVGLNVELLLGSGVELIHRTDYRHGAPLVGDQLRRAL